MVRGTALKALRSPPNPALDVASVLVASPVPSTLDALPRPLPHACRARASCLRLCVWCVGGQTALVLSTAISMCLLLPNFSLALPPLLAEELESRQVGWRASGQWSGVAGWVVGGCLSLGKGRRAGRHRLELVLLWPKCRTGHRLQAWPSPRYSL